MQRSHKNQRDRVSPDILLVDDESNFHYLVKEALLDIGYEGELFYRKDGKEALDFLQQEFMKERLIILCDINMPKVKGTEMLRELYKTDFNKVRFCPFIMLTNSTLKEDLHEALSLSAHGYFQKPLLFQELIDLLEQIIRYWTSTAKFSG